MKINLRKEMGITLIALVITIIVLLILAGIAITSITGENGIIGKTKSAKLMTSHGEVKDAIMLAYSEFELEFPEMFNECLENGIKFIESIGLTQTYLTEYIQPVLQYPFAYFCYKKGYCDEYGAINVEKLVGQNTGYGNSKEKVDVYRIAEAPIKGVYNDSNFLTSSRMGGVNSSQIGYNKTERTLTLDYYDKNGQKETLYDGVYEIPSEVYYYLLEKELIEELVNIKR